jgi:hypothetical protein
MKLTFGKNKGKLIERVMIDDAGYVAWMLAEAPSPSSPLFVARKHVGKCIERFDSVAMVESCWGEHCGRLAVRASVRFPSPSPMFWCASCDPSENGGDTGRLQIIKRYRTALRYAGSVGGTKLDYQHLLRPLAAAKGLHPPRTEARLLAFFK